MAEQACVLAEWAASLCEHLRNQSSAKLDSAIPQILAPAAEGHLRSIIDTAIKVQRRAKRSTLTVDDINFALSLAREEGVYGYSSARQAAVTGFDGRDSLDYHRAGHASPMLPAAVDVASVIGRPLPPAPVAPSFSLHWLAVEGVQPATPQNPPPLSSSSSALSSTSSSASVVPAGHESAGGLRLSREEQLLFGHVVSAVRAGLLLDSDLYDLSFGSSLKKEQHASRAASVRTTLCSDRASEHLMPHFAKFVKEEVAGNLRDLPLLASLMAMLKELLNNPHVLALLRDPSSSSSGGSSSSSGALASSLGGGGVGSPPPLQLLVPSVLTCVVGKRLCGGAGSTAGGGRGGRNGGGGLPDSVGEEDHWSLRDATASILADICNVFGDLPVYGGLREGVLGALTQALDASKTLAQVYGGLAALACLGPASVERVLVPLLPQLVSRIDAAILASSSPSTSPSSSAAAADSGAGAGGKGESKKRAASPSVSAPASSSSSAAAARLKALEKAAVCARKCQGALLNAIRVFLDDYNLKDRSEAAARAKLLWQERQAFSASANSSAVNASSAVGGGKRAVDTDAQDTDGRGEKRGKVAQGGESLFAQTAVAGTKLRQIPSTMSSSPAIRLQKKVEADAAAAAAAAAASEGSSPSSSSSSSLSSSKKSKKKAPTPSSSHTGGGGGVAGGDGSKGVGSVAVLAAAAGSHAPPSLALPTESLGEAMIPLFVRAAASDLLPPLSAYLSDEVGGVSWRAIGAPSALVLL